MWIDPKISIGNLLTLGVLLLALIAGYVNLQATAAGNKKAALENKGAIETISRRVSASSAADTRRANQISKDLAVLAEALKRQERRYDDELKRLREEIGRVRFGGKR